jgi:hypothetical protein
LDSEFLALSFIFILLGLTGIILFYGPMTPAGDSCYCLIPSPEPGAAQSTSSFILALGILFLPIGILKGGAPSFGKPQSIQPARPAAPGQPAVSPIPIFSNNMFAFGIVLALVAVDAILVPGVLVFHSLPIIVLGAVLAALGVAAVVFGLRRNPAAPASQ